MAEFVEASVEKTIDNLDQLRHIGLLSEAEARDVIKSRQAYEYRLARHTKRKKDYINFIQFEINLLEMIRLRRKKLRCFGRRQLDFDQINRVHGLFRGCIFRFQSDVELWLLHIEFAKKHKQTGYVGRLYKRMLQVHNRRPDLWLNAINWEIGQKQPDAARKLFLTALRFNKQDEKLWLSYQRFELQQCINAKRHAIEVKEKLEKVENKSEIKEDDESKKYPDAVTDGRLAVLAFRKALEAIDKNEVFCVSLLEAWREIANTELVNQRLEEVFDIIDTNHSPYLMAAWCKKPMIGFLPGCHLEVCRETVSRFDNKINTDPNMSSSGVFRSLQIQFIIENINIIAPKSSPKVAPSEDRKFLLSKVKALLEIADSNNTQLSEPVIADSIDLLHAENLDLSTVIIHKAVTAYPSSKRLWLSLFESLSSATISREKTSNPSYLKLLTDAFSAPFPDTVSGREEAQIVWHAAIQLCIALRLQVDTFDQLWQKAAKLHLTELGPSYLEWAYHSQALASSPWQAAERAFASVSDVAVKRPLPVDLHLSRLKLAISTYEFSSRFSDVEENDSLREIELSDVRSIFEQVLLDVGPRYLGIWLLWVHFESSFGDVESLTHIAWRARHVLSSDGLAEFNASYPKIIAATNSVQPPSHVVLNRSRKT